MSLAVGVSDIASGSGSATRSTGAITTAASDSTFLIAAWGFRDTRTVSSLVDSKSNTYTEIGSADLWNGGTRQLRLWKCEDGVGGSSHTATITLDASDEISIVLFEITATTGYAVVDVSNSNVDSSSPYTSPSITTTVVDTLLVSVAASNSGSNPSTIAESTGFTIQEQETNGSSFWTGALATKAAASIGSYSSSWTFSGASDAGVKIVAFKEFVSTTPELEQSHFRWRNDDGSETTATWTAAEDTDIAVAALTPKRIRFEITAIGDNASKAFKLQYRRKPVTAIRFKSNGEANGDIRLEWDGAGILPRTSHTVIWRAKYIQQDGYYAVLWHTSNDGTFKGSAYEYGTHPYPTDGNVNSLGQTTGSGSSGTVHYYEMAGLGTNDFIASPGPGTTTLVTKGVWVTQARTAEIVNVSGTDYVRHKFWPDISAPSVYIQQDVGKSTYDTAAAAAVDPVFVIGGSPWTVVGSTNNECASCDFYGLRMFDAALSISDITAEDALLSDGAVTTAGIASLFYSNIYLTPDDVSDKSGNGNNPSWANANRPSLVTVETFDWQDVN